MNNEAPPEIDEAQVEARHMIAQIVERTGLTPSEVARRAGISPSTLTRIYPTSTVTYTLSARTLAKLASAFPDAAQRPGAAANRSGPETKPICEHVFISLRNLTTPAEASELELFEGDVRQVDAMRKVALNMEPNRFFLAYMPSDCMEPRIRAGEVLIIDRVIPPALHADVIVQLRGGEADSPDLICVGQLSGRSRDAVQITQIQHQSVSEFASERVRAIYTIIGRGDRALVA